MKLYYAPGASSLAVHIALREIGAPFDTVAVDLAKHTTADGTDFRTISPRGYVPVLQLDDGSRHTEAAALLPYQLTFITMSSPAQWEKVGRSWDKYVQAPSGTGPWKVERYVPPALNVLRPLLDTLPQPVLTEADVEEKLTLD